MARKDQRISKGTNDTFLLLCHHGSELPFIWCVFLTLINCENFPFFEFVFYLYNIMLEYDENGANAQALEKMSFYHPHSLPLLHNILCKFSLQQEPPGRELPHWQGLWHRWVGAPQAGHFLGV